jgi:hypothetical protein
MAVSSADELLDEIEKGAGGFHFKATRVGLEMEAHLNMDPWALGDALLEDIPAPEDDLSRSSSHTNTGLYAQLEEIRLDMQRAGAETVAKKLSTLRIARATALAWPSEYRRPEIATHAAHKRLRDSSKAPETRALRLERLYAKNNGRRVTEDDVRLWRESQKRAAGKMPPVLSFQELLEQRLRNTLRNWASPRRVGDLHSDDQDGAVRTLRKLATEIAAGTFK